ASRSGLEDPGVRIHLVQQMTAARPDLELVAGAIREVGYEDLPDAQRDELAHRVHAPVPSVDVADDADPLGVRRPDREAHARATPDLHLAAAELLPCPVARALAQQVQVELAQDLPDLVGAVHVEADPAPSKPNTDIQ